MPFCVNVTTTYPDTPLPLSCNAVRPVHQNWGAASLLGGIQIALAFGLGSFLPNTCSKLDQLYILIPDEI